MKQKITLLSILCLFATATPAQATDQDIAMGSRERVENLFSYPNNCSNVCVIDETLETTAAKYLTQSLQRDGFTNTSVTVSTTKSCSNDGHDIMVAHYSGDALPAGYDNVMQNFFLNGDKAFTGANQINQDKKWAFNWRFFFPVGLAMYNQKSVQLLHFPPDYSLEEKQDYLNSKTSQRWEALLEVNGIPTAQVPLFEAIIDIAPIAAPASAGSTLTQTYSYFDNYLNTMLPLRLTGGKPQTAPRPMVAYGAPVRDWVKSHFKLDLPVLTTGTITLPNSSAKVPMLGANHPSYIWYAVQNTKDPYGRGVYVMKQDLASACWQASMGNDSTQDTQAVLTGCITKWNDPANQKEVCLLVETQALGKSQAEAEAFCKDKLTTPAPSMAAPAPSRAPMPEHEPDSAAPWNKFGHFEHLAP